MAIYPEDGLRIADCGLRSAHGMDLMNVLG